MKRMVSRPFTRWRGREESGGSGRDPEKEMKVREGVSKVDLPNGALQISALVAKHVPGGSRPELYFANRCL